jgi:hypothetical protein
MTDEATPGLLEVSRRVDVPAPEIFQVLASPRRHRDFDGTGMVGASDDPDVTGVGDTFLMSMHNDEFGDYVMRNTVVEFERDARIAWAPTRHDDPDDDDWAHRWGYVLEPAGTDATQVTLFFDITRSPDDAWRILRGGETWRARMEQSLALLDELFQAHEPAAEPR